MIDRLACTVMPYAWGSRTALAELTGRHAPSSDPEAELWMGAHPVAPSRVVRDGQERSLADVIADAPEQELGREVTRELGPRLPFLMKVLAAAEPLSLQAHPTAAQARAGFEDEERRGVPVSAPRRNFKDPSHKPELLCALTPFDALCGFRRASDTARLLDALGAADLASRLRERGLPDALREIMTASAPRVGAIVDACRVHTGEFASVCAWAVRLAELHPGDVGVVSALLLNLIRLEPGEAIYLGAGKLHAYLGGCGVEIMASSDNVLRGGLTKKHVDVPALLRVLEFADGPVSRVSPRALDAVEEIYDTPAREFRLSRLRVTGPLEREVHGPEILLCTAGAVEVADVQVTGGGAVYVPAKTARYSVHGDGVVYRATVNL